MSGPAGRRVPHRAAAAASPARARQKRGRPPKFGRPGRVVAVTLPEEVVQGLRRVDPDLGWAIVRLFQKQARPAGPPPRAVADAELVSVASGRALIAVNRDVF